MRTNLGLKLKIQGPEGTVYAKRPNDKVITAMNEANRMERLSIAIALSKAGFTIFAPVDVDGWPYWKTMERARSDGFTWLPAADMPNLPVAPKLWTPSEKNSDGLSYDAEHPPLGAILVPASVEEDPNYVQPAPPVPPPQTVVEFGPKILEGPMEGNYQVGPNDTAELWSIQTGPDGAEYMKCMQFIFWVYLKVE